MKTHWVVAVLLLGLLSTMSAETIPARAPDLTVDVWPDGKMPGKAADAPESEMPQTGDEVHRIINVSRPTLALFKAPAQSRPRPAIVVCPGGAYKLLAYNLEGTEVAAWLNSIGFTAIVLKYRVPANREGAFQDVERALRVVRSHATDWGIDPKRLGVMGFSAGGHLAARLSTGFDEKSYSEIDAADKLSCRPDFAVLVYPAYLAVNGKVAPELNLKSQIPPTLIVHNEDDKGYVPGSKLYHAALDAAKINNTFLFYNTGGHGYGMRCKKEARIWPQQAEEWFLKIGVLSK